MNALMTRLMRRPLLAASIVAILVGDVALASVAISAHGSDSVVAAAPSAALAAASVVAAPADHTYRCPDCGVIESAREIGAPDEETAVKSPGRIASGKRGAIAAKPFRNYEITVRMPDGTMRVVRDPKSARWKQGEEVTIIAGADQ